MRILTFNQTLRPTKVRPVSPVSLSCTPTINWIIRGLDHTQFQETSHCIFTTGESRVCSYGKYNIKSVFMRIPTNIDRLAPVWGSLFVTFTITFAYNVFDLD